MRQMKHTSEFRTVKKRLKLTNAVLADVLGVSERTITRWLTGTTKPKRSVLIALRVSSVPHPTEQERP